MRELSNMLKVMAPTERLETRSGCAEARGVGTWIASACVTDDIMVKKKY